MGSQDDIYMLRCLQLASNGISDTAPNPMVGCVIVHNDTIIGEGYHQRCGFPHAEVNAINSVKAENEFFCPNLHCMSIWNPVRTTGKRRHAAN